ncbi:MAG: fibronectin type III domain-containing protein [Thermodesulfobacteriota bacterium]|jgi:fibronectin type 3 domain-containing protein
MWKRTRILSFLLVIILLLLALGCRGERLGKGCSSGEIGTINLAWDPNPAPDVVGYKVYYGTAPRTYGPGIDVGNVTSYALTGLIKGRRYYIPVTAYDKSKRESGFSDELIGIAK